MDPRLLVMFYIYQSTDVQELKWIPDCIQLSIAVNLVDCIITFESVNVMDCYRITFESVDLPEGLDGKKHRRADEQSSCLHSPLLSLEHYHYHRHHYRHHHRPLLL